LSLAGIGAMSDTYNTIVERLAELMTALPAPEAASLAENLTASINDRISAYAVGRAPAPRQGSSAAATKALPEHLMNFATLNAPWAAYRRAHGAHRGEYKSEAEAVRLVCSVPESLAHVARPTNSASLWSGSLLDALGLVFNNAKEEVLIMNPYWSLLGVQALLRRITRQSYAGVRVLVMTQSRSRLEPAMCDGIELFVSTMESMGATCRVLAPAPGIKPTPLLHAKAIISDRSHGYLGSANLTGSGMDFSVEVGIVFRSVLARQLADWLVALEPALDDWCR
jgi:phosphatidylserine/phosphatidylglycerophosphate/cardiolipin synthase-like enzyme